MIWPFLIIYASSKLNMPLSTVAALISINAGTGLISSLIVDTSQTAVGRKVVMNFSLTVNGIAYFLVDECPENIPALRRPDDAGRGCRIRFTR